MIVVVDYHMGNLGSIMNMLKRLGVKAILSSSAADIEKAEKLILPGVGAFDTGMNNLGDLGLVSILNHKVVQDKTPILGICLGMQLMTRRSEEGNLLGLGWIDAKTVKFKFDDIKGVKPKIPHMGWNKVDIVQKNCLFDGLCPEPRFYFVHSYHVRCNSNEDILSTTFYGYDFVSSIARANIAGVQFHPEKSHKFGVKLLTNFAHLF